MAEKARELAGAIKTKPDTTTQDSPKKPKPHHTTQQRKATSSVRYKTLINNCGLREYF